MSDTSFIDQQTTIVAAWLNVINNRTYRGRDPNFATTTGSANAQVLTLATGSLYSAGSEADGDTFVFKAGYTNTAATTLQVLQPSGSNTAVALQIQGVALSGGEVQSGQLYMVRRLGSTWQLMYTANLSLPLKSCTSLSYTQQVSDQARFLTHYASGAEDITLLAAATAGEGFVQGFLATNGSMVITPNGTEKILLPDGTTVSSLTLANTGQSALFLCTNGTGGAQWVVIAMNAALADSVNTAALQANSVTLAKLANGVLAPAHGRLLVIAAGGSPFSTCQFAPHNGNIIAINGAPYTIPTGTQAASGGVQATYNNCYIDGVSGQTLAATTKYYIYLFDNSGTLTIDFSTTGREIDPTWGTWRKINDSTRTCIGICYTDTSGKWIGSANQQNITSWFNRVKMSLSVSVAGTAFTNTSYAEQNSNNRLTWTQWSDDIPNVYAQVDVLSGTAGTNISCGIGFDSTTTPNGYVGVVEPSTGNYAIALHCFADLASSSEGYHYASFLVKVNAANGQIVDGQMTCSPLSS